MNAPLFSVAVSFAPAAVTHWPALIDRAVSPEALRRVGWVLLHFLWQGAAVAALLLVALRLLRRMSAAVRYRVACAALLAMAVAPVATYWLVPREMPATTARAEEPLSAKSARRSGARLLLPQEGEDISAADDGPTPAGGGAPTATAAARGGGSPWTWVVVLWGAGVAALSVWRAGGWLHLRWLVRRAAPVGAGWADRVTSLSRQMGVRRPVRLAQAAWVAVPCVLGFFRPVILLPAAALTGLTPAQLEAILAHELAHVRRHDYLVNLAQAVLETVLFYHPAVWWVSARVREEREDCCDDRAAATQPSPADYADALAAAEAMRDADARTLSPHLALSSVSGGRTDGRLLRRVRRVLGLPPAPRRSRSAAFPLTAVVVAAACLALPWVIARADQTPPASAAPAPGPASTPDAAPATAPAEKAPVDELAAAARPPLPEDLVVEKKDYAISPSDLVQVNIGDLTGPGTQTVKTARVTDSGAISLPYLEGPLTAAGRTEAQLEQDISKAYRDQNVLQKAQVSVVVTEARGRAFSVVGGVPQPGQYAIVDADFRVLDALALAKADVTQLETIYVLRSTKVDKAKLEALRQDLAKLEKESGAGSPAAAAARQRVADAEAPKPRVIAVPAGPLSAGDPKFNVTVRPGDMVLVRAASQSPARLLVSPNGGLTFGGEPTTWAELPQRLGRVPAAERARLSLVVVPTSDQMTLRQINDAGLRATALSKEYGFRDVQIQTVPPAPAQPPAAPTTEPAAPR